MYTEQGNKTARSTYDTSQYLANKIYIFHCRDRSKYQLFVVNMK